MGRDAEDGQGVHTHPLSCTVLREMSTRSGASGFDQSVILVKTSSVAPKKCLLATTDGLSALTDMAFVSKYFDNESKTEGEALLAHLKSEFIKNLEGVHWMDQATRDEALDKAVSGAVGCEMRGKKSQARAASMLMLARAP